MSRSLYFDEQLSVLEKSVADIFDNKKLYFSLQCIVQIQSQLTSNSKIQLKEYINQFVEDQVRTVRQYFLALSRNKNFFEPFVLGWEEFVGHVDTCCMVFPTVTKELSRSSDISFQNVVLLHPKLQAKLQEGCCNALVENPDTAFALIRRYTFLLLEKNSEGLVDLIGIPFKNYIKKKYGDAAEGRAMSMRVLEFVSWLKNIQEEVSVKKQESSSKVDVILQIFMIKAFDEVLVEPYNNFLLHSVDGCLGMARQWDFDSLAPIVNLYTGLSRAEELETIFDKAIKENMEHVMEILYKDAPKAVEMVLQVLDKSNRLLSLISKICTEKSYMSKVNEIGFCEAVSAFYDRSVKKMKMDDSVIKSIARLYTLVEDEDGLDRALKKSMCVRLANADADHLRVERQFLLGIPLQRRAVFEQLIADVEESWQISSRFESSCSNEKLSHFSLRVTVIRGATLLPFANTQPRLPPCMGKNMLDFINFYSLLHNGRRIMFLSKLGKVKFRLSHSGSFYTIVAPTPFASTILAFNEDKSFSISELMGRSDLDQEAVEWQTRQLLLHGLIVEESKEYRFNQCFTSSRSEIVVGGYGQARNESSSELLQSKTGKKAPNSAFLEAHITLELKRGSPKTFKSLCDGVAILGSRGYHITSANVKSSIQNLMERGVVTHSSAGYSFQP